MKWLEKVPKCYSWFSPYPLFTGVIFSFLVCAIVGHLVSQRNSFKTFQRFHQYVSPETLYYPTASQVMALAEARLDKEKISVIVGGSSVFNGFGQSSSDLWTEQLQQQLGDRYQVLNLAFRGGGFQEYGAIAAQSLASRGYQVIYVADVMPGFPGEPDGRNPLYRYVFWDAYYKGILPPYPARDTYLATRVNLTDELLLNQRLDSVVYANDLWNTLGYSIFFTVWNSYVARKSPDFPFYQPRSAFRDPAQNFRPADVATRYAKISDADKKDIMAIVRESCAWGFTKDQNGSLVETDRWNALEQHFKTMFSDQFKSQTLLVFMYRSPYFTSQLNQDEKTCLDLAFTQFLQRTQSLGYSAIAVGKDFQVSDYNDSVHLVDTGADKLATSVSTEVETIAQQLGYFK